MSFKIKFTQTATNHIRALRKFEQQLILDAIEEQLVYEPHQETRNRKRLRYNNISDWELRVDKYRIFYDLVITEEKHIVKIKPVGHKAHNTLHTGGRPGDKIMKVIEMESWYPTLAEVISLAV